MHLYGFGYSAVITVVPMFVVIGAILVSQIIMRFETVGYMQRELFADTILYIFIFSVLFTSPLNAVLSKYISDIIFEEKYDDIIPCFHLGMGIVTVLGTAFAIPFCLYEHFVGGVPVYYVFTGYCGFTALMLVFYSMLYLSITKSYGKISLFFTIGMASAVLLSWLFYRFAGLSITYSILLGMTIGFLIIASLEIALIKSYFRRNSGNYRPVLTYLKKQWRMIVVNTLYTLGLFIHNFVFWASGLRTVLVKTFVTCMPYDMATCLAMFTNISATIIFIINVELHFRDRYRRYFEAVIGGRGHDIRNAKMRMFRQLSTELMSLIRLQFIISVVVFLLFITTLPMMGIGGLTMRIYPCLCVGYFILFVMYAEILFLYYFNDVGGALMTAAVFCSVTLLLSIFSSHLTDIWYGLGLVVGSAAAFTIAYFRLKHMENRLEEQVFCRGDVIERAEGEKPASMVFSRAAEEADLQK